MATILSKTNHNSIKYIVGNKYDSVYARLRKILTEDEITFFARTRSTAYQRTWLADFSGEALNMTQLSGDRKDRAIEVLHERMESIRPKIAADRELGNIADLVLHVPSDNNIHIFESDDTYDIQLVLSQWGCDQRTGQANFNPLEKWSDQADKSYENVFLTLLDSNGEPYEEPEFLFEYKGQKKTMQTNGGSEISLGKFKVGSQFSIAPLDGGPTDFKSKFTVSKGQEKYIARLPLYTSANIRVINQVGESVSNYPIRAIYNEHEEIFTTDEEGGFSINQILLDDSPLSLVDSANSNCEESYPLDRSENNFSFEIKERMTKEVFIKVINQEYDSVPGHPLHVQSGEKEHKVKTDSDGCAILRDVEIGGSLKVTNGKDEYDYEYFEIVEEEDEYIFQIETKLPIRLTVQVLDHKSNPIPNLPMDIQFDGQHVKGLTDDRGEFDFKLSDLNDKDKFQVQFRKDEKGTEKIYKKKLKYRDYQDYYSVQIKKFNPLWLLLLLLLLPFLLLIELDKEIDVQTLSHTDRTPVPTVYTELSYTKFSLYSNGEFFSTEERQFRGLSNEQGVVSFANCDYTLYSWVFKRSEKMHIFAQDSCYNSSKLSPDFHSLLRSNPIEIEMKAKTVPIDFYVYNRDDEKPIPNAKVFVEYEFMDSIIRDSMLTNSSGRVLFESLPKCGDINTLFSDAYGYQSADIAGGYIGDLANRSDKRRSFFLDPIKEDIEFFVLDCKSGEPIPDAIAEIFVNGVSIGEVLTGNSGLGRGFYEDIHITKKVTIRVNKEYYKEGVHDRDYTVEEFTQLPDSLRTICIDPEELYINFQNYDSNTMRPLEGVKNKIRIVTGMDSIIILSTSNENGVFQVPNLFKSSSISIVSELDPYYNRNDSSIVNRKVKELFLAAEEEFLIPLDPKRIELQFKTVDTDADTLVDNAQLEVFIDGDKNDTIVNSGNGAFKISAYYYSVLSIASSKPGYLSNNDKIYQRRMSELVNTLPVEREIPMIMKPCDYPEYGGHGRGVFIEEYNMGKNAGTFIFAYDTDSAPDSLLIYNTSRSEIANAQPIWSRYVATGSGVLEESRVRYSSGKIITVKVVGESANWYYKVSCPN